jgi:PPOX class probable F420-dependent enzyme
MTPDEISTFLQRTSPALVGVVATTRADGSPHAVPVWYSWDGHMVKIWTDHERAWVRNLRGDERVAFSVQESSPPFGAVTLHGRAEIITTGDEIDTDIARIVGRYLAENECEAYVAEWPDLRTIVRIHPVTVHAWDRGY